MKYWKQNNNNNNKTSWSKHAQSAMRISVKWTKNVKNSTGHAIIAKHFVGRQDPMIEQALFAVCIVFICISWIVVLPSNLPRSIQQIYSFSLHFGTFCADYSWHWYVCVCVCVCVLAWTNTRNLIPTISATTTYRIEYGILWARSWLSQPLSGQLFCFGFNYCFHYRLRTYSSCSFWLIDWSQIL